MGRDKLLFAAIAILVALAAFVVLDPMGEDADRDFGTTSPDAPRRDVEPQAARRGVIETASGPESEVRDPRRSGEALGDAEAILKKDVFGVTYAAIFGEVVDESGDPIADADIELFRSARRLGHDRSEQGERLAQLRSRMDGSFEFHDVEANSAYILNGHHDGKARYRATLAPKAGETLWVRVVLGRGAGIRGTVTDRETGAPLADVEVRVYDFESVTVDPEAAVEALVLTDERGEFTCSHITTGSKRMTATLEGFATLTKPLIRIPQAAGASQDFALVPGFSISGFVTDVEGIPLEGARVTARPVQGGSLHPEPGSHHPATFADASGRYVVDGLGEGLYAVSAELGGYRQGSFGVPTDGSMPMRSRRNARAGDEDVELVLGVAPSIRGRVVDDQSGDPVRAFRLTYSTVADLGGILEGSLKRVEDDRGEFAYSLPLAASTETALWIHALAPGYAGGRARVEFQPVPGQRHEVVKDVVIRMKRGVSVAGRIVDARGLAIVDAIVRVVPSRLAAGPMRNFLGRRHSIGANAGFSASTRSDGGFVVFNVRPGKYHVSVEHESFSVLRLKEPVLAGEEGEVALGQLELSRGGRVRGAVRVSGVGGQEGARVELKTADFSGLTPPVVVTTGLDGVFDFRHVAPGRYTVSFVGIGNRDFRAPGRGHEKPQVKTIVVEEGGDIEVDF